MKNNIFISCCILLIVCMMFAGCSKSDTKYYADSENDSLAIFSNTGNNLLTCLVNDKAWRTNDRRLPIVAPPTASYEVYMTRQITNSSTDTLIFDWRGYYRSDEYQPGYLQLVLPIAKDFNFRNLSLLNRQKITLDTTNGYFSFYSGFNSAGFLKGTGSIYFHECLFDSIGPNRYKGKISGLFEADLIALQIKSGRFDHTITSEQILF